MITRGLLALADGILTAIGALVFVYLAQESQWEHLDERGQKVLVVIAAGWLLLHFVVGVARQEVGRR
jgi:hypothetical protein